MLCVHKKWAKRYPLSAHFSIGYLLSSWIFKKWWQDFFCIIISSCDFWHDLKIYKFINRTFAKENLLWYNLSIKGGYILWITHYLNNSVVHIPGGGIYLAVSWYAFVCFTLYILLILYFCVPRLKFLEPK